MANMENPGMPATITARTAPSQTDASQRFLHGPIVPVMLQLSLPSTVVMIVQILVGLAETYFVSFLGTDALAAVTLVFPILTFMQMVSNGDFGGAVASSVARALGAGRKGDTDAIVLHALLIGIVFGVIFTVAEYLWGASLYAALGGSGAPLAEALSYGHIVFGGAVLIWIVSLLAAALRGAGNVVAPAAVVVGAALIVVPLSPALIFGWGPLPQMGIRGAAIAVVVYYLVAALGLLWYLRSGRNALRMPLDLRLIERRLWGDILRIGAISAIRTTQSCLAILILTGAAGLFGTSAIAGYGIASRLDFILIPLLFGLGTSALTMIGVNIGAGQPDRAYRIAVTGTLLAAIIAEVIGIAVAVAPGRWLGIFSADPGVIAEGSAYLQIVAPAYGFFGAGILIFSAGQAIRRLAWVFLAATVRLVIVGLTGWIALGGQVELQSLFVVVAASYVAFGLVNALTLSPNAWRQTQAGPGPRPS